MLQLRITKFLMLVGACALLASGVKAFPDYLKVYNADPMAKAEFKGKCAVCHVSPAGGGARNEFGNAFAKANYKISPALRQQFPAYFASGDTPNVSFTGADEATIEINGKRYAINTKDKTVKEIGGTATVATAVAPAAKPTPDAPAVPDNIYKPVDVRVINLPSAVTISKGSLWTDFTHRFPSGKPTDAKGLFGLDTIAYPSFGVLYGLTDRVHIGAYRSPGDLGRAIQVYAGVQALRETEGKPVSVMARVALEGRDNFQRNFATSLELTVAKSITRHAQAYVVPTVTFNDRAFSISPEQDAKGTTAAALGVGLAVAIRPSVSLLAEVNQRLNDSARYKDGIIGIRRPAVGFGIQKQSISKRHAFSLVFSNSPGTTISQRSQTRGLFGNDDTLRGLTIGFNIVRRIF